MVDIRPLRPSEPLFDLKTGGLTASGVRWFNDLLSLLNTTADTVDTDLVLKADYSADNTILKADTAGSPLPLQVDPSSVVGRTAASAIGSLSSANLKTILAYISSDITESGNLYYTNERVDDRVAALIQNGTGISWTYNDVANTLTANVSITQYTDEMAQDTVASLIQNGTGISWSYNDGANTLTPTVSLAAFSTSNLSEGANLYFTDERVDDRVAVLIQNGTGITWSYNDGAGTLTPTVTVTQYTDEMAEDAVGGILTDTAEIDFTYNDGANTITADLKANSVVAGRLKATTTDIIFGRSTAGAGAGEEIVCTAAGRALIDDAAASNQRTTLGVTATGADTTYAFRANNLSDLASAATARGNLSAAASATTMTAAGLVTGGGDLSANRTFTVTAASDAQAIAQSSTSVALTPANLAGRASFSADKNGTDQTGLTSGGFTKITFTNETFDVGSYYDSTNSKWTPPAGKVWISVTVGTNAGVLAANLFILSIYKNGARYRDGAPFSAGIANNDSATVTILDNANGTDYYEIYLLIVSATTGTAAGSTVSTYWQGAQM